MDRRAKSTLSMNIQCKHTPGPWAVDGEGTHVAAVSKTWEITAPTVARMVRPDDDQTFADACLIAKAPELYAELRRFLHDFPAHRAGQLGNGNAYQHWERTTALLAEIDGGTR